jgi:Kef-type K+ transport system membrane component KefB
VWWVRGTLANLDLDQPFSKSFMNPSMPVWTLEGLRNADPLLGLALVMLLGVLVAEALHRFARLPRVMGMMLVGALASPFALSLIESAELDPWKPLLDLAIGVLVFELGSRIRPQWLFENPWLAASCVLEGVLAGVAVTVALSALGAPMLSAAMAGAVAMSTSPVITMAMVHEDKPRGQVTERLLMTSALNSIVAMLAVKAWRVMAAAESPSPGVEMLTMAASALYVTCGSFLVGVACGWLLHRLSRASGTSNMVPVLQIALVIIATLLAAQWKLSPLLALLVAGVTARLTMGHRLTVEPHLGSAGAVLTVLLFISLGLLFTLDGAKTLWPWALAIIFVRFVGKGAAIAATAGLSGLGWRQAIALTLALQPMSSLAVLLAADTFGWPSQLLGIDRSVLQALLLATTVMQLSGPLWVQWGLRHVARECDGGLRSGAR